jgi:phage terminase small subunit
MAQPGRKSLASLSVFPRVDGSPERLRAPEGLTEPEAAVFAETVASCAASHFVRSDMPMLCGYCRAVVAERRAAAELEAGGWVNGGKASPWLVVLEKAQRAAIAYAQQLKLTPRSRARKTPEPPEQMSVYDLMRLQRDQHEADEA